MSPRPTNRFSIGNKAAAAAPTHSTGPPGQSPARAPLPGRGDDARPPHARREAPGWAAPTPGRTRRLTAQLLPRLDLPPPPPLRAPVEPQFPPFPPDPAGNCHCRRRRGGAAVRARRPALSPSGAGAAPRTTPRAGPAGAPRPGSCGVGASPGRAGSWEWNPSSPGGLLEMFPYGKENAYS